MNIFAQLAPGVRLYDRYLQREYHVHAVEKHEAVVFLHLRNPHTGDLTKQPYAVAELDKRFDILDAHSFVFQASPTIVSLVAESYRIQHAYLFNPLFATETSLIDLLPHQLAAVYGVPRPVGSRAHTAGHPGMLDLPRLRFLLADDAGAGKTIMAGLLTREMLLRRQVKRVLVVPPAGLVGNWERELRILFRLRFHILASTDAAEDHNPFTDPRHDLAIVSVDTLWRERMRAAYLAAPPYDLVIFDEAHKLSAGYLADLTIDKTKRYEMAELVAKQGRHLLLMTATPHMGKDDRYYMLWRLLEPELLSTQSAYQRLDKSQKQRLLLRRMKEEMVTFDGAPLFKNRDSQTVAYPLRQGSGQEQGLYDQVTEYCETHFDRAQQRNRSAAGLAMSILQRRVASSIWAVLKSMERREQKLATAIQELELGLVDEQKFAVHQQDLPKTSVRDVKTGDEEESIDGLEEGEQEDRLLEGATDAATIAELKVEQREVRRLVSLARQVYEQKHESKFEQLWDTLAAYPDTKVLIFTEFRDTLDFLIDRLEGKGLTGKIAQIHGGMDYRERERQAAFFRETAQVLVATDAAGEGINLQFCWLLVNYDIPWNPARLEQRMGRVHRYKQTHDVVLLNVLSQDTREGRVLTVLLEKLAAIRDELGSDKVFDIIGQQFSGKPLAEFIFEASVKGKEDQAMAEIERINAPQTEELLAEQERRVEVSEVRGILHALQEKREVAAMRRMMPAYIRRFVQLASEHIGLGIQGDVETVFRFDPCPVAVAQALSTYPESVRQRLTFDRELAKPDLTQEPRAIYIHPGEPVFEAVTDLLLGKFDREGMRGAVFYDAEIQQPYLFYLARTTVLRDDAEKDTPPEVVEEQMTGLRRYADGCCELAPAHLLLTLLPHDGDESLSAPRSVSPSDADPSGGTSRWALDAANDHTPAETFVFQNVTIPALETRREKENRRLPEQIRQLRVAYNLRGAELMRQRRLLKEAVANGVPAASSKLRECETEMEILDEDKRKAEAALRTSVDRLRLGPVTFYAQALVLPLPPEEAERRVDMDSEKIALAEVIRREEAAGSVVQDVSDPTIKAGFDLKVLRADGTQRYVEVKGRRGVQSVELTANEWAQAANHRDRYWLYVVYHCESVPVLHCVPDPFKRLMAKATGAMRINSAAILAAAL